MGVGLCTYDATEKSAIETMTTQAFWAFDVEDLVLIVLKVQQTNECLMMFYHVCSVLDSVPYFWCTPSEFTQFSIVFHGLPSLSTVL